MNTFVVAALLAALTVPAQAPAPTPLGAVRLSQQSGSVTATPMFASGTASVACPSGYGRNALLRVGPPGGPYANLAKPLMAGGYDRKPVSAGPNRSFATALAGAPAAGAWEVVVECFSETAGQHAERFITPITVAGDTWKVGAAAGSRGGATPAVPAAPTPAAEGSGAALQQGDQAAPAQSTRPVSAHRSGSGLPGGANLWWAAAIGAVLLVLTTMWLTRRRPDRR